uniref:Uncharacterized protein n=1 Tax=Arundo donax TaxID=35708 RepID=A0A0A8YNJ0_ARUDO
MIYGLTTDNEDKNYKCSSVSANGQLQTIEHIEH